MRQGWILGGLAFGLLGCASAAQAELKLCNTGSAERTVAVAYKDQGSWLAKGWWKIAPGACKVVVGGDLKQQHYYYTLRDDPAFQGEGYSFCTQAKSFKLPGADGDCAALAAEPRDFAHIDSGQTDTSFTFNLADAGAGAAQPDQAAQTASFAPGTHGDPFTVEAVLQGCGETESGPSCTFYAEGARWIATKGQVSNDAALAFMAGLPVNAPMRVTGDVISFGDITVDAAVSKAELGTPDAYAAQREAMQGDWVDADDPKSQLSITGSEQTASYDGQLIDVSVLSFGDQCPGGEPIGPVMMAQVMGGDPMDVPCYAMLDISPDRMELSYVGRGNTLVYVRP